MQCVFAHVCSCSWCVCVSMSPLRCCQCLGTCPYFYRSGTVSVYSTVQNCGVLCWHGCWSRAVLWWHSTVWARFGFTLVFSSVLCWTKPCWHGFTCQCRQGISFLHSCLDSPRMPEMYSFCSAIEFSVSCPLHYQLFVHPSVEATNGYCCMKRMTGLVASNSSKVAHRHHHLVECVVSYKNTWKLNVIFQLLKKLKIEGIFNGLL